MSVPSKAVVAVVTTGSFESVRLRRDSKTSPSGPAGLLNPLSSRSYTEGFF